MAFGERLGDDKPNEKRIEDMKEGSNVEDGQRVGGEADEKRTESGAESHASEEKTKTKRKGS